MKKFFSFAFVIIFIFTLFNVTAAAFEESIPKNIVNAATPTQNAELLFSKRFGANYKNSPTSPVFYKNFLIVMAGNKIYKVDARTGDTVSEAQMAGETIYATIRPTCVNDIIYAQVDGGMVQAFDFNTMKSLWVFKDTLGGQAICPITYSEGFIYTGFWRSETKTANFVCFDSADTNPLSETEIKTALWQYESKGGFYWSGAYVSGDYVVFGTDDGERESGAKSKIVSLNKNNGQLVSSLETIGDIRSTVVYSNENDSYYLTSKSGYIYKFKLDEKTGKLYNLTSLKLGDSFTATPVVYKNRMYIGGRSEGKNRFFVINAETLKPFYFVEVSGYPQTTPLVSTGYEETTGKIYVYFSCNSKPGGLMALEDSVNSKEPVLRELYSPQNELSEYSISYISASDDGVIYFKNDSGCIFAVWEGCSRILNFLKSFTEFLNSVITTIFNLLVY